MKAVTLRNVPEELARIIRQKACEERTSINRAVINILAESLRIRGTKGRILYHDLDALAGSWTKDEQAAFEKNLKGQRKIDPELWK